MGGEVIDELFSYDFVFQEGINHVYQLIN